MSTPAEKAFAPVLREIESGLALPIPTRVRILRELEYDLEELWRKLVADGVPAEEARRRALQALVPDAGSLVELDKLHKPLYRRLTSNVSARRLRFAERSALFLATSSVLLVQTLALLRFDLLQDPSPFLWPVLISGILLFGLVITKAFQLWIKRDHAEPEKGLGAILVGSGVVLGLGLGGVVFDFYRMAGSLEGMPELAGGLTSHWLVQDSALLSVAIILALAGGLAWFLLSQWLALVSGARLEVLGLNDHEILTKEKKDV